MARRISNQESLLGGVEGMFREDAVADLVVVVVECLDGIEVAVDDDVEQAVQQEAHPVGGEVRRTVPALEHGADREAVVLADGDEPALVDERVDLGLFEAAIFNVDAHGVARTGRGAWRSCQALGADEALERLRRRARAGRAHPRARRAVPSRGRRSPPTPAVSGCFEVLRDVCDAEALRLERPLAVHPGHSIGHGIPPCPVRELSKRSRFDRFLQRGWDVADDPRPVVLVPALLQSQVGDDPRRQQDAVGGLCGFGKSASIGSCRSHPPYRTAPVRRTQSLRRQLRVLRAGWRRPVPGLAHDRTSQHRPSRTQSTGRMAHTLSTLTNGFQITSSPRPRSP